jgi:hypothetical protein
LRKCADHRPDAVAIVSGRRLRDDSASTQRRNTMLAKITLAIAVAISLLATVSASAGPGDEQYSSGYLDNAYNKHGW